MEKYCIKCRTNKRWSEFYKRSRNQDGLAEWCKECAKAAVKASVAKNSLPHQEAVSRWKNNNPAPAARHSRRSELKRKYGITLEQYELLYEQQGGLCAICHKECSRGTLLAVDHDHATGAVRGLLCRRCNLGLGNFRDSTTLLYQAIVYLSRLRTR